MKIGFLITARLKSSRLKLKILKKLNGFTVIERVIHRAKQVKVCKDVVLCTSRLNQDIPLNKIAKCNDIYYYNGSSKDVLLRLLGAAELYEMDYFVGITADNPLFSIYHANMIANIIKTDPSIDFIYTSGLPVGANTYAIKTKALKTVCGIKEEIDTEIWGDLINQPEIFNVKEVKVEKEYQAKNFRMTLDEIDDYKFFEEIYNKFPKEDVIDLLDVYEYLKKNSHIVDINSKVTQRDLNDEAKTRISNFYRQIKDRVKDFKESIYNIK